MAPKACLTIAEIRQLRLDWRGETIAFVPTMGALHEGHLDLVKLAKSKATKVVVSIFVNPTQFGPNEDFAKYPRTLQEDMAKLADMEVDAVFLPAAAEIYPPTFQTMIHNLKMASELEGTVRPQHFQGMLTVVWKLFMIVAPNVAIFGKKDYQQWRLVCQMVRDLNLPDLDVIGLETVREPDGLAMSSRNRFLEPHQREVAAEIYRTLQKVAQAFASGERQVKPLETIGLQALQNSFAVDYFELRRAEDLSRFDDDVIAEPAVVLTAARLGSVRLLDNIELKLK